MDKDLKFPFYARLSLLFVGMFAFISMLYIGRGIILPLIFAVILAIVLHPVVKFFVRIKINRIVAISITLILAILALVALGTFLFSQLSRFGESWPKFVEKFTEIYNDSVKWASGYFEISSKKIIEFITKTRGELINPNGVALGTTIINVGSSLLGLILIPVYIFMILFYQPILVEFFRRIFGADHRTEVSAIIAEVKTVIQRYLTGLVIEAIMIAAMNIGVLLILGIEYAILIGIIGALLNIIPYLGGLVAVALPMMIALVTKASPWYAVYVLAAYYFIQLVDNHYIVPFIVASKVKINALISIIVVLAFGSLWGIPGMFISIPLTAIAKVIFDHIEPLKAWGFLLGDTMPTIGMFKINLKKK